MIEKAYLIKAQHFKIQEFNFEQLKEYTDNVILEYFDNKYFKRALFEMDRLGYNIGILIPHIEDIDYKDILLDLLQNIRGFNINLGVWVDYKDNETTYNIFNTLHEKFSKNFIVGLRNCPLLEDKENTFITEFLDYPYWGPKGDIENNSIIMPDFTHFSINTVLLNTDYKTIYEENNLEPIKSDTLILPLL